MTKKVPHVNHWASYVQFHPKFLFLTYKYFNKYTQKSQPGLINLKSLHIITHMTKTRLPFFILAILIGVFLFIFGGYDDSPGAQMLGLLTVIMGIVGIIKKRKKNLDPNT